MMPNQNSLMAGQPYKPDTFPFGSAPPTPQNGVNGMIPGYSQPADSSNTVVPTFAQGGLMISPQQQQLEHTDVPAGLAQGEFVLNADETRYIGLKHLNDLKAEAAKGMAQMAESGHIQSPNGPPPQPNSVSQPGTQGPQQGNAPTAPSTAPQGSPGLMGKPAFADGGYMTSQDALDRSLATSNALRGQATAAGPNYFNTYNPQQPGLMAQPYVNRFGGLSYQYMDPTTGQPITPTQVTPTGTPTAQTTTPSATTAPTTTPTATPSTTGNPNAVLVNTSGESSNTGIGTATSGNSVKNPNDVTSLKTDPNLGAGLMSMVDPTQGRIDNAMNTATNTANDFATAGTPGSPGAAQNGGAVNDIGAGNMTGKVDITAPSSTQNAYSPAGFSVNLDTANPAAPNNQSNIGNFSASFSPTATPGTLSASRDMLDPGTAANPANTNPDVGGILGGVAKGASMGSSLGPLGAAVGGIIGGAASALGIKDFSDISNALGLSNNTSPNPPDTQTPDTQTPDTQTDTGTGAGTGTETGSGTGSGTGTDTGTGSNDSGADGGADNSQ